MSRKVPYSDSYKTLLHQFECLHLAYLWLKIGSKVYISYRLQLHQRYIYKPHISISNISLPSDLLANEGLSSFV